MSTMESDVQERIENLEMGVAVAETTQAGARQLRPRPKPGWRRRLSQAPAGSSPGCWLPS